MPCSEGVFIGSCGEREGVDDIYQAPPQLVVGRTDAREIVDQTQELLLVAQLVM